MEEAKVEEKMIEVVPTSGQVIEPEEGVAEPGEGVVESEVGVAEASSEEGAEETKCEQLLNDHCQFRAY